MTTPNTSQTALPAMEAFQRAVSPRVPLYALLDAAKESRGPYEAKQAGLEHQSLFTGDMGDMLKNVAPYLIEFRRGSSFESWWFEQWGNSIGVLLEAPASFADVRKHFRTLLMVRGPDRKRYYFRFYDPRVLPSFLETSTAEEVERCFGPVRAFYCEGKGGGELLKFTTGPEGAVVKSTPIQSGTSTAT